MTALLITAAAVALCAALAAAKDKMNDHWDRSLFARLSGGDDAGFFGHRDYVWLRRYRGGDARNPKLRAFTVPILRHALEAVWDFYHLATSLQLVVVTGAFVWLAGLAWWWTLALLALSGVTFEVFYRRVWT